MKVCAGCVCVCVCVCVCIYAYVYAHVYICVCARERGELENPAQTKIVSFSNSLKKYSKKMEI
jgi:hypothetical protein